MMKNILLLTLLYSLASVSVATDNFVECYEDCGTLKDSCDTNILRVDDSFVRCYEDCGTPKDNCEVEKTKKNQQNTYVIKEK